MPEEASDRKGCFQKREVGMNHHFVAFDSHLVEKIWMIIIKSLTLP